MPICANCRKDKPAVTAWGGERDSLTLARIGFDNLPKWCDLCAVTAKVEYHRAAAARLPELEARLRELTEGD